MAGDTVTVHEGIYRERINPVNGGTSDLKRVVCASTGISFADDVGSCVPEFLVDQASLPGTKPLFSPRFGFNWDVTGNRSTQLRGGTGIFTGRVPFVWVGNVISNPGANPNLWAPFSNEGVEQIPTSDDAILQQSFDLNGMDPDFKWPSRA